MDRKFISRLFINRAKESGKVYLKGEIKVPAEDLKAHIQSDGSLKIPVFGHTFEGTDKLGNEYKAFNLEVRNEDNQTTKKDLKKDYQSSKTGSKNTKKDDLDSPF